MCPRASQVPRSRVETFLSFETQVSEDRDTSSKILPYYQPEWELLQCSRAFLRNNPCYSTRTLILKASSQVTFRYLFSPLATEITMTWAPLWSWLLAS